MPQRKVATKVSWDKAIPAPVVLISGPEHYHAGRAFNSIKRSVREKDPNFSETLIAADSYGAGELLTLVSPSLFGEFKLIMVEHVEKLNTTFLNDCKQYIKNPSSEVSLVLRHSGGNKGRGLLEAVRKESPGAIEVLCPEVKPKDRAKLVRDEISRLGGRIDHSSLIMLVEAYQTDLAELMSVTNQIVQLSGGQIENEHVEQLTGGRVEANAFRVADAALSGDTNNAIVLLRQSLSTGTAAIALLAAINLKIRTMAKVMGARNSSNEIAKTFGIAPWQAQRASREVSGWKEKDLAKAIDIGAQTELMLKGGARNPEYALEKFVLFIANRGRN